MFGLQQSSSRTSADSIDSRFTNIEKTLNEISNMAKNRQINATYQSNNPKGTRIYSILHVLQKLWSHSKFLLVIETEKKLNEEKRLPNRRRLILKITQID